MKKRRIIMSLLILSSLLMGCNNNIETPSIEEKGTYNITSDDTTIYIQNLSEKFDNQFNINQMYDNTIEFETKDTMKGYTLVSYSLVEYDEEYITQLKNQIKNAEASYTSMSKYYDIDNLSISQELTLENDFGILKYQYVCVPLLESNNLTYSYVAWQQIGNQLLIINEGGLAIKEIKEMATEYFAVSKTPINNDIYLYIDKPEESNN